MSTGERVVVAASLALAGMCISFFLEPLIPLGSWLWLFGGLLLIALALRKVLWPHFIRWSWWGRVGVLGFLVASAWLASRVFPGEKQEFGVGMPAEATQPAELGAADESSPEKEDQDSRSGPSDLEKHPLNLDPEEAHVKSGRQVRLPREETADYVAATIGEIVGPLWRLTEIQVEKETEHYLGRKYAISGRVGTVGRTLGGEQAGFLFFDAPLDEPQVVAYLGEAALALLSRANVGDRIVASGEICKVSKLELTLCGLAVIEGPDEPADTRSRASFPQ